MHSVKLDINDNIYDKVMFFLNNISKDDLNIKEIKDNNIQQENTLAEFFKNSPLVGEINLRREPETYSNRVRF
ncbi:MAG: hypothetical protein DRG78_06445 [Epsilonproteobacteria bacterium]|nr:MAG: hypothetical protein DRG78_06445 [Campylobacterota bacterium]